MDVVLDDVTEIYLKEWNASYKNGDNFLFYPDEAVISFTSKFIRKRIGLNSFKDVDRDYRNANLLDLGCGIGRHVFYGHDVGVDSYGIDLSNEAIEIARHWAVQKNLPDYQNKFIQGDIRHLPWNNEFFRYVISHGVLDSMSFNVAKSACLELARVMEKNGLFYCTLISGDDSFHSREFCGEETVSILHEQGTIQSYFTLSKIQEMVDGLFVIQDCALLRHENIIHGGHNSRYYIVFRRI